MNYEQLLESRHGAAMAKQPTPFGDLHKSMIAGKYVSVISFRDDLRDSLLLPDCLQKDEECDKAVTSDRQIRFATLTDSAGLYGVSLDQGSLTTFAQLLDDHPAVIAESNFLDDTVHGLLQYLCTLHEQGIYHVCFSPDNVFARKGDHRAMLLFHGSSFLAFNDQQGLYGPQASDYVAPEVLDEGVVDARSDVYAFGKFMAYLYQQSEVPLELKGVLQKATEADPDKRYQSAADMLAAVTNRQSTRRSIITTVAALIIVALCFGLYFTLVPEREDIEFVKAVEEKNPAGDPLEADVFDPEELAEPDVPLTTADSAALIKGGQDDAAPQQDMRVYNAKAEQIFRKRYAEEAGRVLSKIYSKENMNATEKKFLSNSQATMEELVRIQQKLGKETGLKSERSQLLATQIIDQVSATLKKAAPASSE